MPDPLPNSPQLNGDWTARQTAWYLFYLTASAVIQVVATAVGDGAPKQALIIASAAITIFLGSLHLYLDKLANDRFHQVAASAIVELRSADPPSLSPDDAGRALRFLPTTAARVITLPAKPPANAVFVIENMSAAFDLTVRAAPPATLAVDTLARAPVPAANADGASSGGRAVSSATYEFDGSAYTRH